MARKNDRERAGGEAASSRGKGGARKSGGAKRARTAGASKGARKAAGSRKTAGARKSAGGRKAAGRKTGGAARKQASRKNARGKTEAREMAGARQPRGGAAKKRSSGRGRAATPRRGAERARGASSRGRGQARKGSAWGGYSASTQRALWIESPDQHAERPGQTLATRDHNVIRQWAEERGAVPATIAGTEHDGRPGVLRFDFPNFGQSGGRLRPVDWDEWFETFDQRNLVFLFQEQMKNGNQSNFFRLDSPDREDG